ncbi:polysaccharide deacetylase family protein [Kutzneria viridogrisea]|uniref:NodB homology domain-containing protein n=2 Tax=Kutzneria TaxID=43356 RepID=W5WLT8_9PSEU|nr:polysaccharide deacetylase family protein [Kutzneria albida]AHI01833.1 hypothetical protein KALB_8476 [Kutzneria albida DSM 43870]MBA8929749.1 peptidoglycan/xylan/chitin deacetylase (PgdA/CDA1 family) [Kutzneria viridogrisea]
MIGRIAALTGAALAAHALPAVTAVRPLRERFLPALSGVGEPSHVALTIDDGPHPVATPRFLHVLDTYGVHATFFLLGSQLALAPELGKELVAAGHEIAVHGWDHRCLLLRGPRATHEDIIRSYEYVGEVTGQAPRWYRPPYGVLNTAAVVTTRTLGLTPVLWTSWGRDWELSANPESVFRTVTSGLSGGGTILLHDSDCTSAPGSWAATLGALPRIIEECERRGLKIGTLGSH